MKKILGLFSVVFLALVLMTSCQKDENKVQPDNSGQVTINAVVNTSASTSFKSTIVERGDVPVYVRGVDVDVTANASGYTVHEGFLYEVGGTGNMLIEGVALGQNTIDAVSLPVAGTLPHTFIESQSGEFMLNLGRRCINIAVEGIKYQSFYKWYGEVQGEISIWWWTIEFHKHLKEGTVPVDAMSDFISFIIANERDQVDGAPIYAVYTGTSYANVVHNNPAVVNVDMTTNNGRQMVTFTVDNLDMLDLYDVAITGDCPTSPQEDVNGVDGYVQLDSNTPFAISYWSNATAVNGASTNYTIEFKEKGSNVVLRTITMDPIEVTAGVSMWTSVIITENAFYTDEQALTFTYDPLDEEDEEIIID